MTQGLIPNKVGTYKDDINIGLSYPHVEHYSSLILSDGRLKRLHLVFRVRQSKSNNVGVIFHRHVTTPLLQIWLEPASLARSTHFA